MLQHSSKFEHVSHVMLKQGLKSLSLPYQKKAWLGWCHLLRPFGMTTLKMLSPVVAGSAGVERGFRWVGYATTHV